MPEENQLANVGLRLGTVIVKIVRRMPVVLQLLVVLFVLGVAGLLLYEKFFKPEKSTASAVTTNVTATTGPNNNTNNVFIVPGGPSPIATAPDTHAYVQPGIRDDSKPNADNHNPQNRDAERKSEEDNAAFRWHTTHQSKDNPPEVSIGADADENNYLHYRYYDKTDRCVLVNRREGGVDHPQWIKDPLYHQHDLSAQLVISNATHTPPTSSERARSFDLIPAASAQVALPSGPQFCVNPHPHNNNFTTWWGPPIDSCNSGLYRQFADGCVHYQVYNRCANSWDGRIFWTYCHAAPHY